MRHLLLYSAFVCVSYTAPRWPWRAAARWPFNWCNLIVLLFSAKNVPHVFFCCDWHFYSNQRGKTIVTNVRTNALSQRQSTASHSGDISPLATALHLIFFMIRSKYVHATSNTSDEKKKLYFFFVDVGLFLTLREHTQVLLFFFFFPPHFFVFTSCYVSPTSEMKMHITKLMLAGNLYLNTETVEKNNKKLTD